MNCPHCNEQLDSVDMTQVNGALSGAKRAAWNCVGYSCPSCNKVLSVQINPLGMKSDILNEVSQMLGKKRPAV